MFEKHKAKKAAEQYREALAQWQTLRDGYSNLLEVAQQFQGEATDEIMVKPGEALFYKVTNTSLIEERTGPGAPRDDLRGFRSLSPRSVATRCATTSERAGGPSCRVLRS